MKVWVPVNSTSNINSFSKKKKLVVLISLIVEYNIWIWHKINSTYSTPSNKINGTYSTPFSVCIIMIF